MAPSAVVAVNGGGAAGPVELIDGQRVPVEIGVVSEHPAAGVLRSEPRCCSAAYASGLATGGWLTAPMTVIVTVAVDVPPCAVVSAVGERVGRRLPTRNRLQRRGTARVVGERTIAVERHRGAVGRGRRERCGAARSR